MKKNKLRLNFPNKPFEMIEEKEKEDEYDGKCLFQNPTYNNSQQKEEMDQTITEFDIHDFFRFSDC